eukprot:COSAG04_NODE_19849_length_407_cov_0.344156_1_plen_46_part_01
MVIVVVSTNRVDLDDQNIIKKIERVGRVCGIKSMKQRKHAVWSWSQ